jgi:integrase
MALYKRGRIWWIGVTANGERIQISTGTTNKRRAQKIHDLMQADAIEGRFRLPKSNSPTVEAWAAQFLESISHPVTKRTYKSCVQTLNKFFGPLRLSQITAEHIERFKAARTKAGAGPAIINRNLAVLRRMLKLAARQRLITRNAFEEIEFLEERSHRRQPRIINFEEQGRLETVAPPLLRTLIVVLTETGLRIGKEALRLLWEDVDLLGGVIHVRSSKTPAGRRAIPISEYCRAALEVWRNLTGPAFSSFVFPHPNNPLVHLKAVRKTWTRALRLAKLSYFPIYCLRATFASRLSAAGASDNLVAGMLGHSSPSIVSTYAKVVDEFRRDAIRKLETLRTSKPSNPKEAALLRPPEGDRWVN